MSFSPHDAAGCPAGGTDGSRLARRGIAPWLPAALLLAGGLATLVLVSFLGGGAAGRYLVIAPPGASLAETINMVRAADGRLVQAGRFPNMVVAGSDRPDFATAARRAGAWLAIAAPDGGGCIDPYSQEKSS